MEDTISNKDDHMTVDELVELFQMVDKSIDNYEPLKILDTLDFAIDASNGNDSYSVGFRNGLRYAKSLIDGKEPQFESNGYVNFITRKSPQEAYKEESEDRSDEGLTTYQIYLVLLGYLSEKHDDTGIMLKAMLTELYKRTKESEEKKDDKRTKR